VPILAAGQRPHREQDVQVPRPAVDRHPDAQWQVHREAPRLHASEAWIDVLALAVVPCRDQPLRFEGRGEVGQDLLPIPGRRAAGRLHHERVPPQEAAAHGQRPDDGGALQRAARPIPGLDVDACAPDDPVVAVVEHPDVHLVVEDQDMRIPPEHTRALCFLARGAGCRCSGARAVVNYATPAIMCETPLEPC